jgi:hypothetical protein
MRTMRTILTSDKPSNSQSNLLEGIVGWQDGKRLNASSVVQTLPASLTRIASKAFMLQINMKRNEVAFMRNKAQL